MKKPWFAFLLVMLGLALTSPAAQAAAYTFSGSLGGSTFPACVDAKDSKKSGTWSGSSPTYTCSESITLKSGDSIASGTSITVIAKAGITLAGNNAIGSSSVAVNLQTEWGDIVASNGGNKTTTIYGNLTSSSGSFFLTNTLVNGSLSTDDEIRLTGGSVSGDVSGRNGVTTTSGTLIGGNVTANAGKISLSGGSVTGSVHSDCCTITATNTDIGGNLSTTVISSSSNTVTIIGGTVSGAISTSGGSGIVIQNATVTSGSISATNVAINISNSTIGSPGTTVNISGNNRVTLSNGTTVYGNVTAGNWSSALTIDGSSIVYGVCTSDNSSLVTPPQYPRCATAPSGPDHIQLELSGSPLTCAPSTVTVKACTSAAPGCAPLSSTVTTVTLGASNGALWSASPVTFTGSTTVSLRKTTVGPTTLSAVSGGAGATACYLNSATNNCQISFEDSALLLTIPLQTAGVVSSGASQMSVAAVRASTSGKECVAAFGGQTRNVKFWSSYDSPSTGSKTLAVKGTTVPTTITGASTSLAASSASTGTAVELTFDATGTASVPLKYDDAGRLLLNARYDGSAANSDASLVMTGSSLFVTAPYGLCVDSPDQNPDATPAWLCAAADVTCSKYRKAGEDFKLRVTGKVSSTPSPTATPTPAQLCAMPSTANYQQNDIVLAAKVVAPCKDAAPATCDGQNGVLGTPVVSVSAAGSATIDKQTHSEVGVFTFTATPPANAYFGAYTVAPGTSANFGRFVPAGFTIIDPAITPRKALACDPVSAFTYLGEGLGVGFTLQAVNLGGAVTTNYRGSFARLSLAPANALYFGAQDGATLLNGRLATACSGPGGACGVWGNGTAAIAATATVGRKDDVTVDGPFVTTQFGFKVVGEPDSVTVVSPDFNWSLATPAVNDGLKIGDSTALRFGRLKLSNVFGSAKADLKMPVQAQYWSGKSWVLNGDDSCSKLPVSAFALYPSGVSTSASAVALSSGKSDLTLAKPSPMTTGYVDVAANLGASGSGNDLSCLAYAAKQNSTPAGLPWLRFLNGSCSATTDRDPSARATFGRYSPESKTTVHVRELY